MSDDSPKYRDCGEGIFGSAADDPAPTQEDDMLPYSLQLLSDALPKVEIPTERFDPNGEWEHNYAIWIPSRGKDFKSEPAGSLRIRRRLTPDGNIRLVVTQIVRMKDVNGSGRSKAAITCVNDKLCAPIRWQIDSEVDNPDGKQVRLTSVSISGEASGGSITLDGKKITASERLSSSWSLFDAVQRLPFDAKELRFDMLEEMELLKPDQMLWAGETAEMEIGGRKTRLHSFEQIGWGILPFTYWIDDNHRLIVAVSQRRAYLLGSASSK